MVTGMFLLLLYYWCFVSFVSALFRLIECLFSTAIWRESGASLIVMIASKCPVFVSIAAFNNDFRYYD